MSDSLSGIFKASSAQTLGALRGMIRKSEAHARALKIEDSVLLNARVYPDMLPATRQIQIACDTVARGAARLSGVDVPSFPDTEQDFPSLIARCQAAQDYALAADSAAIDRNELVTLKIPMGPNTMEMTGRAYASSFILPNLHFHAAIFYALMRQQGVVIGKMDYLTGN